MDFKIRIYNIILFIVISSISFGQTDNKPLNLVPPAHPQIKSIHLNMPVDTYKKIRKASAKRSFYKDLQIEIEGESRIVKELKLRGKSSIQYERKSFSIDLAEKASFSSHDGSLSMKSFYLVSLVMDKNYFNNRLAFDLLQKLGLFGLYYKYVEVKINGESQGIYLLFQRPQDWAEKVLKTRYVARRGYESNIAKEKKTKGLEKTEIKNYRKQYREIYSVINKLKGAELYDRLENILDIDAYMQWMAFNHFIRNGDYTDEVYFCIDAQTGKFRIIPWDYDDIFMNQPHEGLAQRKTLISFTSLVFSSEDPLDVTIANDPYLYAKYLQHYQEVLTTLDDHVLNTTLVRIYKDLYPLFKEKDILLALEKDGYQTNLDKLEKDMKSKYTALIYSRYGTLSTIEKQLK